MHHFSSERGPAAFPVCVRFPGNPMKSVLIRKPRAGNSEKPGPSAFPVCVRFPGNPMKSVSVRKPRAGNSEKRGPAAASVCVRFPGNPMKSVLIRKPRAGQSRKHGPAPANQKSRRVPAYFSASISSPSTGSNFTPYQWSGSSRVFLMQARV